MQARVTYRWSVGRAESQQQWVFSRNKKRNYELIYVTSIWHSCALLKGTCTQRERRVVQTRRVCMSKHPDSRKMKGHSKMQLRSLFERNLLSQHLAVKTQRSTKVIKLICKKVSISSASVFTQLHCKVTAKTRPICERQSTWVPSNCAGYFCHR